MKLEMAAMMVVLLAGSAGAETLTWTRTGNCTLENGALHCASHATVTGQQGQVGTRDRASTLTPGRIETTVQGVRRNGQGFARSTVITR